MPANSRGLPKANLNKKKAATPYKRCRTRNSHIPEAPASICIDASQHSNLSTPPTFYSGGRLAIHDLSRFVIWTMTGLFRASEEHLSSLSYLSRLIRHKIFTNYWQQRPPDLSTHQWSVRADSREFSRLQPTTNQTYQYMTYIRKKLPRKCL